MFEWNQKQRTNVRADVVRSLGTQIGGCRDSSRRIVTKLGGFFRESQRVSGRDPGLPFRVLLVEDSTTKSLKIRRYLEAQGFTVIVAPDGEEGLITARRENPDAIVSDVLMPRLDGFELCRQVRSDDDLRDTPIVLVTAAFDRPEDRDFALRIGADAYFEEENVGAGELALTLRNAIVKRRGLLGAQLPWSPLPEDAPPTEFHQEHAERLRSLVADKMDEIERSYGALAVAYDNVLEGLIAALDLRDTETEVHSWRVAEYSLVLATRAGLGWASLTDIERGALLHDIGKIGISDAILRKPGPLEENEWEEMRKHPQLGYEMIVGIDFLRGASEIVLTHHERWDGGGYPHGLSGEDIPIGARIFALADTIHAITTDRPYRAASSFEDALRELGRQRGTQFDPNLVDVALQIEPPTWNAIREDVELRRRVMKAKRAGRSPITSATLAHVEPGDEGNNRPPRGRVRPRSAARIHVGPYISA